MYILFTILIVLAAVLLVLLVLVQNSKGGGLAAGFASGNQVMGAPKTADFLEKATWTLAAVVVLFSIFAVGVKAGSANQAKQDKVIEAGAEQASQSAPAADMNGEAAE